MTGTIKLSAFRTQGNKIRVNDEYVVTGIDLSDLSYFIKDSSKTNPRSFYVAGKEKTVEVFCASTECRLDGDVDFWTYESLSLVETNDGPRRVAISVYND
jgi:hypothetical protein